LKADFSKIIQKYILYLEFSDDTTYCIFGFKFRNKEKAFLMKCLLLICLRY
jgi:hypothetical protein